MGDIKSFPRGSVGSYKEGECRYDSPAEVAGLGEVLAFSKRRKWPRHLSGNSAFDDFIDKVDRDFRIPEVGDLYDPRRILFRGKRLKDVLRGLGGIDAEETRGLR